MEEVLTSSPLAPLHEVPGSGGKSFPIHNPLVDVREVFVRSAIFPNATHAMIIFTLIGDNIGDPEEPHAFTGALSVGDTMGFISLFRKNVANVPLDLR